MNTPINKRWISPRCAQKCGFMHKNELPELCISSMGLRVCTRRLTQQRRRRGQYNCQSSLWRCIFMQRTTVTNVFMYGKSDHIVVSSYFVGDCKNPRLYLHFRLNTLLNFVRGNLISLVYFYLYGICNDVIFFSFWVEFIASLWEGNLRGIFSSFYEKWSRYVCVNVKFILLEFIFDINDLFGLGKDKSSVIILFILKSIAWFSG